ncbi:DUF6134 family protein [Fulvivirga lutimaris]|uniref:DUF6134 family protein n=1 Tax=Fulvivirga lutimaris TaxID=1819566 RepID=UPI0012BC512F|nr:DUF6134 family protein [Fulvivirga lutimaris]MTI39160.1 hypothetical protein [Fulvivirga lutimaris]
MPNRLLIVLLLILFRVNFNQDAKAQQHSYTINLRGDKIGEISATKTEDAGMTSYLVVSDVTFKVLWKSYNRKTEHNLIIENDRIKKSYSGIYMNKNKEDSASMEYLNNNYKCFKFPNKHFNLVNADISYFSAKMYFEEPVHIKSVFSERFLEYCPLEALGDHKYKLSLPNGKDNIYTYVDGKLVEVYVDRTWFSLKFEKEH